MLKSGHVIPDEMLRLIIHVRIGVLDDRKSPDFYVPGEPPQNGVGIPGMVEGREAKSGIDLLSELEERGGRLGFNEHHTSMPIGTDPQLMFPDTIPHKVQRRSTGNVHPVHPQPMAVGQGTGDMPKPQPIIDRGGMGRQQERCLGEDPFFGL